MNFTAEQIEQARKATTAEELMEITKGFGLEINEDTAAALFAQLNPKTGELSDDELDNVAGGGCDTSDGHTIVTSSKKCFTGAHEPVYVRYFPGTDSEIEVWTNTSNLGLRKLWWGNSGSGELCGNCKHLEFTSSGTGYCSKS